MFKILRERAVRFDKLDPLSLAYDPLKCLD